MMSEEKTNPHLVLNTDDVLCYLVGAVQRIEMQLASDEPPQWAQRLFNEIKNIKSTCINHKKSNGSNGKIIGF
jgi:hypothetical protein